MYIVRTNREKQKQHVKIVKNESKYNNLINYEKKSDDKFKISVFFIEKKTKTNSKYEIFTKKKKRNKK